MTLFDCSNDEARLRSERWASDSPPICGICGEYTIEGPGLSGYRICGPCREETGNDGGDP